MSKPIIISPRSRAFAEASQQAGFHSVCLIGWDRPWPFDFGDNRGRWHVRVTTAVREVTAAERADLESPDRPIHLLEYVQVKSQERAKRLRNALHEVLTGQQEEKMNDAGRHSWRNVRDCWDQDDPDETVRELNWSYWWAEILKEASRIVKRNDTAFRVYQPEETLEVISRKAVRGR